MRAIVQRVSSASVAVDGSVVGRCGPGYLLLVGVHVEDSEVNASRLADKIANLRIFNDGAGKMNLGIREATSGIEPNVLAISNFTVYGDASKNRRPSFTASAGFDQARELFDRFVSRLADAGLRVETGVFGADMAVTLTNDGPVTLVVDG